jgi:hypothetical protein
MKYLSRNRARLAPECVEVAIRRLGQERYVPAAGLLASWLDFKSTIYFVAGDVVFNTQWGYRYPAALALYEIGLPAEAALVRVFAAPSLSDTVETNAGDTLMLIHRDDMSKGVAALTAAAKATPDAVISARLRDAARRLASTCRDAALRSRWEAALN